MKLNELDLNAVAKIRESTNFTVREIRKVCKTIGPRAAGSESEDKAQDYILENCAKFADKAEKETFKLAPRAFMAWPWLGATVEIIAILFYIASGFVSDPLPTVFQGISLGLTAVMLLCGCLAAPAYAYESTTLHNGMRGGCRTGKEVHNYAAFVTCHAYK